MSEQQNSCGGKPILVLKAGRHLSMEEEERLRQPLKDAASRIGAEEVIVLRDGLDLSVLPAGLDRLAAAIKEQAQANLELAASIRLQADAIADLVETVASQGDDDDEPEGLGHLGTL